jgi:hypothetical protein
MVGNREACLIQSKEANMKNVRNLGMIIAMGVVGCGPVGPETEDAAEVEQSVVDLTNRVLRSNYGNALRHNSLGLRWNTYPSPPSQLWTLTQTGSAYYIRMPNSQCLRAPFGAVSGSFAYAEYPCDNSSSATKWTIYSGTLEGMFQLKNVAYPGLCITEEVSQSGFVQPAVLRPCQANWDKQRMYLDD